MKCEIKYKCIFEQFMDYCKQPKYIKNKRDQVGYVQ